MRVRKASVASVLEDTICCVFLGGASGSGRPAGIEKDRQAASGWIGLAAHWNGFLPNERGQYLTATKNRKLHFQVHRNEIVVYLYSCFLRTTSMTLSIVGDFTVWDRVPHKARTESPTPRRRKPTTSTDRASDTDQVDDALVLIPPSRYSLSCSLKR